MFPNTLSTKRDWPCYYPSTALPVVARLGNTLGLHEGSYSYIAVFWAEGLPKCSAYAPAAGTG
jgi:hypothetical protein